MLFPDLSSISAAQRDIRGDHQRVANAAEDHVLLLGEVGDHLRPWCTVPGAL